MALSAAASTILHDAESNRFSLYFEETSLAPVAYVEYALTGGQCPGPDGCSGVLDLYHTFTDTAHRGKGWAEKVVLFAFEYALTHGHRIVPSCSYISGAFLSRHPGMRRLCVTSGPGQSQQIGWRSNCDRTKKPNLPFAGFREVKGAEPAALGAGACLPPRRQAAAAASIVESDSDSDSDSGAEAAQQAFRHLSHMFTLSYTQYACKLGVSASGCDLAFGNAVASSDSLSTLSRFGVLLVTRGKELHCADAPRATAGAAAGCAGGPSSASPALRLQDGSSRAGKVRRSQQSEHADAASSAAMRSAAELEPGSISSVQCFERGARCLYRCWELDTSGDWLTPSSDRALEICVLQGYDVGVTNA
jgi:GNAT superfamily N-acetyltransferase